MQGTGSFLSFNLKRSNLAKGSPASTVRQKLCDINPCLYYDVLFMRVSSVLSVEFKQLNTFLTRTSYPSSSFATSFCLLLLT